MWKILIDFISQVRDMDIHNIGRGIKLVIKDPLGNHPPGDDLPRMSHEELKEGVFLGSEFDPPTLPKNPVTIQF